MLQNMVFLQDKLKKKALTLKMDKNLGKRMILASSGE